MEKIRIVIVVDGFNLVQAIKAVLACGIASQDIHLPKSQTTPELRSLNVVFDAPDGQLVLSGRNAAALSIVFV